MILTALALPAVELNNVKNPTEAVARTPASGSTYTLSFSGSGSGPSATGPRPSSRLELSRGALQDHVRVSGATLSEVECGAHLPPRALRRRYQHLQSLQ